MTLKQYLRIIWARKWLILAVFLLVSAAGIAATLLLPKQYTAETSLIVEVRVDPALGALAPALAAPGFMATQVEVLKASASPRAWSRCWVSNGRPPQSSSGAMPRTPRSRSIGISPACCSVD